MALPRIDQAGVQPGDRVTVTLDGRPYDTVIDAAGRQRFVEDMTHPLVRRLRDHGNRDGDVRDLNEMAVRYQRGEFDQREYAEMNMALGYSVDGFRDLSSFQDMDLDNPLDAAPTVYDATDVVRVPLTVSRSAAAVIVAVLDEGPEALDHASHGVRAAREEARRVLDALREELANI